MSYRVQTILIPRVYPKSFADKWIKQHGYKPRYKNKKPDITENFYRYRQREPIDNAWYFTRKLPNGIELVFMKK